MKQLTQNFSLAEFEHSNTATRLGLDNRVPAHLQENLDRLARKMQCIRDFLGYPVFISSGYRCAELNRLVQGAVNSHHRFAAACDWICPAFGTPLECASAIAPHVEQFCVQQLILEFDSWVHVSILPVSAANRVITIDRLGVRPGLHSARNVSTPVLLHPA